MQRHVFGLSLIAACKIDQHADLAVAVNVTGHVLTLDVGHAVKHQVLTDTPGGGGQLVTHRIAIVQLKGLEFLGVVGPGLHRRLGDLLHQGLKVAVAGHEIGLAVHLDHGCAAAVNHEAHQPLAGLAVGLLGGLDDATFTQQGYGLVLVAVGVGQGLLDVHHARAGHLAQLLD